MRYSLLVEKTKDGYYAYCPQLPGCGEYGSTPMEAIKRLQELLKDLPPALEPDHWPDKH